MLSFGCILSRRAPLRMFSFGTQRAKKGHSKDSEVGANCIVLLVVLCSWERGGVSPIFVAKAFGDFLLGAILETVTDRGVLGLLAAKLRGRVPPPPPLPRQPMTG